MPSHAASDAPLLRVQTALDDGAVEDAALAGMGGWRFGGCEGSTGVCGLAATAVRRCAAGGLLCAADDDDDDDGAALVSCMRRLSKARSRCTCSKSTFCAGLTACSDRRCDEADLTKPVTVSTTPVDATSPRALAGDAACGTFSFAAVTGGERSGSDGSVHVVSRVMRW